MRILVVEDEPALAEFLARALRAEGYTVRVVNDGPSGERIAIGGDVDLMVLDVMLPGKSGFDVLRAVRSAKPDLPVVMLTARGAVEDRVMGLDLGADDYVTKPFSLSEVLARVRANLRKPGQRSSSKLEAGELSLDLRTRRVERGGQTVELSTREFDLLAYLMRHPGQVLSRGQILDAVWGHDFDTETKVVETYISTVRRKLAEAGEPAPIETIRNAGYRLVGADG
ncbi:MAG: two-component system, OmpR family, response regulator [Thermoleophilaceae bacterium]|jgi:two-component system OmpR family response regulator|nr:two-component system, OmpR family, response regulator [Thermoleophilaceae bacterium]